MTTFTNTFEFIGELRFGKEPVKVQEFDSGWTKKSIQLSVLESKNNSMFVSLEGGYHKAKENKVYSFTKGLFGEKGNQLVIDWDNRFDQDTIDSVADFKKTVVDLTVDEESKKKYYELRREIRAIEDKKDADEADSIKLAGLYEEARKTVPYRKEFLHQLDAVEYLEKISEKIQGKKFRVKGQIEASHWNGKNYISYNAQSFELVPDEYTNKLSANVELFFTKNSFDKSSFKKERKFYIDTYISQYSRDHEKDVFFPYNTIFNAQNHDDENTKHLAHIDLVEDAFTVKGKSVFKQVFELRFVNGAEVVEVTVDNLTDKQKRMIDAGLAEPKDFVKTAFGDRVSENRIYVPILKDLGKAGNYTEGAIETDYVEDDLTYVPVERKEKETKVEEKPKKVIEISEDDLPF